MTPEKLTELEKLESTATPGEWNAEVRYNNDFGWAAACGAGISHAAANADAAFTAALRNNARDLFAALREAWAKVERLERERADAKALLGQAAEMLRGHSTCEPDDEYPNGYCVMCGVDSSQCNCEPLVMCKDITAFLERKP